MTDEIEKQLSNFDAEYRISMRGSAQDLWMRYGDQFITSDPAAISELKRQCDKRAQAETVSQGWKELAQKRWEDINRLLESTDSLDAHAARLVERLADAKAREHALQVQVSELLAWKALRLGEGEA